MWKIWQRVEHWIHQRQRLRLLRQVRRRKVRNSGLQRNEPNLTQFQHNGQILG